jgi:mRNA interferase MazF
LSDLSPGAIIWVAPDVTIGREQAGRRPALVVSSTDYLAVVDTLAVVVPITTVDRGWPNHVRVRGGELAEPCWAMTEQVRTIARERIVGTAGHADSETVANVRTWLRDFLDL